MIFSCSIERQRTMQSAVVAPIHRRPFLRTHFDLFFDANKRIWLPIDETSREFSTRNLFSRKQIRNNTIFDCACIERRSQLITDTAASKWHFWNCFFDCFVAFVAGKVFDGRTRSRHFMKMKKPISVESNIWRILIDKSLWKLSKKFTLFASEMRIWVHFYRLQQTKSATRNTILKNDTSDEVRSDEKLFDLIHFLFV